ncbi:MAG: hypothetical protein ACW981_01730 [Candidatus Hodarchaeales archaeon]|jgi:hypothetical protein
MNQKSFQFLLLVVSTILITGLLLGSVIHLPAIQAVDANTDQGINDAIVVNRIPQVSNSTIEVNQSFEIVIIIDNVADQTIYEVAFNQSVPELPPGDTLKIIDSSNNTFNEAWVSYSYDIVFPGERKLFNLTLIAETNKSSSDFTLESLNVSYLYSEIRIPSWRQSDFNEVNSPQPLVFTIVNSNLDEENEEEPEGIFNLNLDLELIAPFLFIGVPLVLLVGLSYFWSKKNLRNEKKRV